MPIYQNTAAAQSNSFLYGSMKVEVSLDSGSSYTNVGLARAVAVNEVQEVNDIQADNGPDIESYVSSHTLEISIGSLEFYLPTYDKIRGGIDILTQVSTGSTTATDSYSTGGSSADKFIALQNQGTGTTGITISSVKQVDTGGTTTTLTVDADYVRMLYADQVGIIMLNDAGSSYNSTESLVVAYSYDKVASNKLSSGGLSAPASRWYRFTNTQIVSGASKYRYIYVYSAEISGGLNLAFKSDNDADPILEAPITLKAKLDTTRTAGDQLWLIEDQVGVAS